MALLGQVTVQALQRVLFGPKRRHSLRLLQTTTPSSTFRITLSLCGPRPTPQRVGSAATLTGQATTQLPQPKQDPLAVTVKINGDAYIGETPVGLEEIAPKLKAIAKNGFDEQIYVRGDTGVPYGVVMKVMSRINAGGFKKLSFVLDEEKGG